MLLGLCSAHLQSKLTCCFYCCSSLGTQSTQKENRGLANKMLAKGTSYSCEFLRGISSEGAQSAEDLPLIIQILAVGDREKQGQGTAIWVYTGWGLCDLNPLGVQETIGTGRGRRVPAKRAAPCLGCLRGAGHGLHS